MSKEKGVSLKEVSSYEFEHVLKPATDMRSNIVRTAIYDYDGVLRTLGKQFPTVPVESHAAFAQTDRSQAAKQDKEMPAATAMPFGSSVQSEFTAPRSSEVPADTDLIAQGDLAYTEYHGQSAVDGVMAGRAQAAATNWSQDPTVVHDSYDTTVAQQPTPQEYDAYALQRYIDNVSHDDQTLMTGDLQYNQEQAVEAARAEVANRYPAPQPQLTGHNVELAG